MIKPRKNISLDLKTYSKLRKLAYKRNVSVAQLIRELVILNEAVSAASKD